MKILKLFILSLLIIPSLYASTNVKVEVDSRCKDNNRKDYEDRRIEQRREQIRDYLKNRDCKYYEGNERHRQYIIPPPRPCYPPPRPSIPSPRAAVDIIFGIGF